MNCSFCNKVFARAEIRDRRNKIRDMTSRAGIIAAQRQEMGWDPVQGDIYEVCLQCMAAIRRQADNEANVRVHLQEGGELNLNVQLPQPVAIPQAEALPEEIPGAIQDEPIDDELIQLIEEGDLVPNADENQQQSSDEHNTSGGSTSTGSSNQQIDERLPRPRRQGIDFGAYSMYSDDEFLHLLGVNKTDFGILHESIRPHIRPSPVRITQNALAMLLMKMRLGVSQKSISALFGMSGQANVSQNINKVLDILHDNFVPLHLGYDHINRRQYIDNWHTRTAEILCQVNEDRELREAITILDGTYIYIEKASNFALQKQTYSLHKHRNLVKAMMIVAPNGKILEIECCYYADGVNNDASIFRHMVQEPNGFTNFFQNNDIIVWDRGFRDVDLLARNLGFRAMMPHLLVEGTQHTDIDANESRLITRMRWVVESINGRLKNKFKFFDRVVPITYLPNLDKYLKVAAAIINAFGRPAAIDAEAHIRVAREMLNRLRLRNLLYELLLRENLLQTRINTWLPLFAADLDDFPVLTEDDVREITLGVYQLNLARPYTDRHMDDGQYLLRYRRIMANLLRIDMRSRHRATVRYSLFLQYRENGVGHTAILGWYCKCIIGRRTLGCCSHIASAIWYLGYARHFPEEMMPKEHLDRFIQNAGDYERFMAEEEPMPIVPEGPVVNPAINLGAEQEQVGEDGMPILLPEV